MHHKHAPQACTTCMHYIQPLQAGMPTCTSSAAERRRHYGSATIGPLQECHLSTTSAALRAAAQPKPLHGGFLALLPYNHSCSLYGHTSCLPAPDGPSLSTALQPPQVAAASPSLHTPAATASPAPQTAPPPAQMACRAHAPPSSVPRRCASVHARMRGQRPQGRPPTWHPASPLPGRAWAGCPA